MKIAIAIAITLAVTIATPATATFYQELHFVGDGDYSLTAIYQGPEHTSRIEVRGEGRGNLKYRQAIESTPPDWWDLF